MTTRTGIGEAKDSFKFLGISAVDMQGNLRSTDSVLFELADKFKAMPDGTKKTALAMDILGKSGKDLIPLLNAGSEGLGEMLAEADSLGIVLSTKTAQSAEAFNDSLERLKTSFQGVLNAIIESGFLDTLTDLVNRFATWIAGFVDAHPQLAKFVAIIGAAAAVLGPLLLALGVIIPILAGPVGIVVAIVAVVAGIAAFIASNETARRIIKDVWNGIKSFIGTAIGAILDYYGDMAEIVSRIGILPDAVQRKMASLSKSLKAGAKSVKEWGKETTTATKAVVPAVKETKKFADVFSAPRTGLNPVMKEADKKAEALKKQQDKLKQSFADTLNPSQKLGEKLKVLVDEFDREDVVKAHWEQILKARDASVEHKTALDPLVISLVDEAEALEEAKTKAENLAKEIKENLKVELEEAKTKTDNLAKAIAKEDGLKEAFAATINPSAELGTKLGILMTEFDREDQVIKAHATADPGSKRRECGIQD